MLHMDVWMTVYILVFAGILGAVFGSFINCMAWRIAHGESVWKGRSHCAVCNHVLGAADLVPVFGYLFRRGRCHYCGEKISPRYMFTELGMAVVFVSITARFDVSFITLRYLALACILLGLALVDLEIYEIPDSFIIAGIVWWTFTLPLVGGDLLTGVKEGLIGAIAIGGGMLVLSLIFDKVLKKESLGGGDIKLFFMVGLYLGALGGLLNLILSCVLGLVFVVVLKKNKIPFGPAIALSTWITILAGEYVIQWYVGLF